MTYTIERTTFPPLPVDGERMATGPRAPVCARRISRRRLLRIGGASVAGSVLVGAAGRAFKVANDPWDPGKNTRAASLVLGDPEKPLLAGEERT